MFEIGWTEILFVGLVAIFVLKPKDYPEVMRSIGAFISKARTMAGEFQGQFQEAMKDPSLQQVKQTIDEIRDIRNLHPVQQVKDTFVQMADEATKMRKEVEGVVTGSAFATGAVAGATAAAAADGSAPTPVGEPSIAPPAVASLEAALPPPPAIDVSGPPVDLVPPARVADAPPPAPVNDAAPPPAPVAKSA
jgi:sec-independent protein translocase protein TatB